MRHFVLPGFLIAVLGAASFAYGQDTAKRGRKYKESPPTSHVEVTVLRGTTGKPIPDAAVIFHPLENGRDNGNMELKTNEDGKAILDLLETGSSVRIQVIANGWQTYGQDYKVDKDKLAIEVKLHRPTGQYSIYKNNEGKGDNKGAAPDTPKPDSAKPDAPKDASPKDAQSGAADDAAKADTKPQDPAAQPK